MKIISFATIKGGVGKTTLMFNYAEWLVKPATTTIRSNSSLWLLPPNRIFLYEEYIEYASKLEKSL